jgi:MFS family permease
MSARVNYQIYTTAVFAAIGGFLFGYDLGVISGVITMSNFLLVFGDQASLSRGSLTSAISGSIVGVMSIGCFIGALLAGQASDRYSRKYSILLFSVIFILSGGLQAAAANLTILLLSRLIAGKVVSFYLLMHSLENKHRCECWSLVNDCASVSIGDLYQRNSWTIGIISAMGYHHRHRGELLD